MSLAKNAPKGLKDCECKKITLPNRPPISYVPEKDCVQDTVSALKAESLMTKIGKGVELWVPIWHSGMRKAFLLQVGSALDAIEKKGSLQGPRQSPRSLRGATWTGEVGKATLAEHDGTTSKGTGSSKKPSKKLKEATAIASQPDPNLQAEYQSDLEKAKEAAEKAKVKVELAAQEMFHFYANLLTIDAKYVWNKIVQELTQSVPYMDLQGIARKGTRGYLQKAFDSCMAFHLLTMFPNNAAQQERYYITNELKKS